MVPLFGAMLAVLGRSWDLCWRTWPLLGPLLAVLGRLGPKNVEEYDYLKTCLFLERERDLPPRGAVLGLPWTLCWRSWAAPGTYAAGLGALLGLCCRSWAALGPYVEGLGPLLGPLLAVLGCLGPKSGQGPGGEAIWPAIRAEKSPEQLPPQAWCPKPFAEICHLIF